MYARASVRLFTASLLLLLLLVAVPPAGAAAGRARPDLTVRSVSAPPASAAPGAVFAVHVRTRNEGEARARGSVTAFFLSRDASRGGGDLRVGSRRVSRLRARSSSVAATSLRVPAVTPPARYRMIACADADGRVREASDRNNCRVARGVLVVTAPTLVEVPPVVEAPAVPPVVAPPAVAGGGGGSASSPVAPPFGEPVLPAVAVADATVAEGDSGTTPLSFAVTLDRVPAAPVSVAWTTADDVATAPADYTAATGTVTFAAGQMSKTVTVQVQGDTLDEDDETVLVDLGAPSGVTIADGRGVGTIADDDPSPAVSIAGATPVEGNAGTTTASFAVTLSAASGRTTTVDWATADGTATQPSDYVLGGGTVTFAPGDTSATVSVTVNGDSAVEPDETFAVTLASPVGLTLGTATATATIANDDPTAGLRVTEVNPNIAGSLDLLELEAVTGGSTNGMQVFARGAATAAITLPAITVAAGDLIVVHYGLASPGWAAETASKTSCADPACYAGAWDIHAPSSLPFSDLALDVRDPAGEIVDGVPFSRAITTGVSGFLMALQDLQARGLWAPVNCGGVPCTDNTTPSAHDVSVAWDAVTTGSDTSASRVGGVSEPTFRAAEWAVRASSFGAPNP